MRLLDLVKQEDGERPLLDCVRELAAFLEADVPRRRAHEALVCMLVVVLRHVESDAGFFVTEEELRE